MKGHWVKGRDGEKDEGKDRGGRGGENQKQLCTEITERERESLLTTQMSGNYKCVSIAARTTSAK